MNPVIHFEMPYDDSARVTRFYETAFGWKTRMLGAEMGHYITAETTALGPTGPLKPGAINGGLFARAAGASMPPSVVTRSTRFTPSIRMRSTPRAETRRAALRRRRPQRPRGAWCGSSGRRGS
jgi:hypothetical protein